MSEPELQPKFYQLSALLSEFEQDAEKRYDAKMNGRPIGALTGLKKLDRELGGALSPGLHVLTGSPGSGKTALALQLSCSSQCPSLYVTLEMSPIELLRRITARLSGQYLGRFKTGEFPAETALMHARKAIEQVPLFALCDGTNSPVRIENIEKFAGLTRKKQPDNEHLLIVIDSAHSLVRGWPVIADEYTALNDGLSKLRALAQRLNCAILVIGERNRASMNDSGMNSAAGSRIFEYSSETVFALDKEKEKDPISGITKMKLTISKNRNGAPGNYINLNFTGALQEFNEG